MSAVSIETSSVASVSSQASAPARTDAFNGAAKAAAYEAGNNNQRAMAEPVELSVDPEALRANVQEAITRLNEQMRANGRDLQFSLDDSVDRMVITVKSRESGEMVRQIPNEAVLNVARHIEELKGILYSNLI